MDRVVDVDDVAESTELICDTILFDPIDEEKENVATITSSPARGGTNDKHGTCLTPRVWNNIASTPQHRGTNGKHDASPALPVWNLSSFLDILPRCHPWKLHTAPALNYSSLVPIFQVQFDQHYKFVILTQA